MLTVVLEDFRDGKAGVCDGCLLREERRTSQVCAPLYKVPLAVHCLGFLVVPPRSVMPASKPARRMRGLRKSNVNGCAVHLQRDVSCTAPVENGRCKS